MQYITTLIQGLEIIVNMATIVVLALVIRKLVKNKGE